MLQAIRVLAVAAILGAARRLHVSGFPRFRAERTQKSRGMRGARANFHIVGLQQCAALLVPIFLQGQDDLLEGEHVMVQAVAKVRILPVFGCRRQHNTVIWCPGLIVCVAVPIRSMPVYLSATGF